MKKYLLVLLLCVSLGSYSQVKKKVLFIGNSYTAVNNLPSLVANLANSDGKLLDYNSSTPGGYTLEQHTTNANTLNLIGSKAWDFVVLQEQSQLPSFPAQQVANSVYPYAAILVDSIYSNNLCSVPLFYDTWGRQNGDPQWDSINTFNKMNTRLYKAYKTMAKDAKGMLSPVGIAFKYIKDDNAAVVSFNQLYQSDQSHPTLYGSYLAACVFYNIIFSTNSEGNSFSPTGISNNEAAYLQSVAKHVVYDMPSIRVDYRPLSENDFTYNISQNTITFTSSIHEGSIASWDFGDGTTSTNINPSHSYATTGSFQVKMITQNNCYSDTLTKTITINTLGIDHLTTESTLKVYPNPSINGVIHLNNRHQTYAVYNLLGKEIYVGKAPVITLPKGVYILKIKNNSKKIIVL